MHQEHQVWKVSRKKECKGLLLGRTGWILDSQISVSYSLSSCCTWQVFNDESADCLVSLLARSCLLVNMLVYLPILSIHSSILVGTHVSCNCCWALVKWNTSIYLEMFTLPSSSTSISPYLSLLSGETMVISMLLVLKVSWRHESTQSTVLNLYWCSVRFSLLPIGFQYTTPQT